MSHDEIHRFWFQGDRHAWRAEWFKRDAAFDAACAQYAALAAEAAAGRLDGWAATPEGALALVLLLDQMPRNLNRDSAAAFAADPVALRIARAAVLRDRLDLALTPTERAFLYLPFEHAEDLGMQNFSVALFEGLRDDPVQRAANGSIPYAWRHRAVIARFGRFPHRNPVLGRATTAAEAAFLVGHPLGF